MLSLSLKNFQRVGLTNKNVNREMRNEGKKWKVRRRGHQECAGIAREDLLKGLMLALGSDGRSGFERNE